MCMDMCMNMCIDMCFDMCIAMFIDMYLDMCMDLCIDMCIDMCVDMSVRTCVLPCVLPCISSDNDNAVDIDALIGWAEDPDADDAASILAAHTYARTHGAGTRTHWAYRRRRRVGRLMVANRRLWLIALVAYSTVA